jgi:5-(carboxyamino)imidazole ribonucleotide mutase
MAAKVAIIMGSESDWKVMQAAQEVLQELGVAAQAEIVSAHRTPDKMFRFAKEAKQNGFQVIIAGAGGAAHLPGMVAALTTLPVIGVPVKSSNSLDGWDSILSILQMPGGIPVATVALDNAKNAGLLAAQILALADVELARRLEAYRASLAEKVLNSKLPD